MNNMTKMKITRLPHPRIVEFLLSAHPPPCAAISFDFLHQPTTAIQLTDSTPHGACEIRNTMLDTFREETVIPEIFRQHNGTVVQFLVLKVDFEGMVRSDLILQRSG